MPYQLYINGEWTPAAGGETLDVMNPATGEAVASCAYGDVPDAIAAMDAAQAALGDWKARTAYERATLLHDAAERIRRRAPEIARVLTLENGKPLAESQGETVGCAGWLDWFAEEGKRVYGRMIPSQFGHKRHWVLRQPIGGVVAVNPWNFPINLMSRKLAAGLAAGCTVLCRPATQAPLSAMLLFECLDEAGLPPGTVGQVTGPADRIVPALLAHPACRKLAFTGSTEVGQALMRQAGKRITKLSLELGGHAPLIVFPDVDLPQAVEQTIVGKFRNAGQSCIAATRIFVHRDIFEDFTDAVVQRTERIAVGNGLDDGVEMGPLFDRDQLTRAEVFVADAVDKGARVLTGGRRLTGGNYDAGCFFAPTVLGNVNDEMRLMTEEIFAPILPLIPFEREEDAVRAANTTEYGLAGYVLTRDFATAVRVSEMLECGVVGLNDTVPTVPQAPFGGWKESGIGREGGYEGIDAYMETKYISVGL